MSGAGATITLRVEWADTDAAGHHHHSNLIRWVESAESALYRAIGHPQLMARVPRVAYAADYVDRLFHQDEIEVSLVVERLGRSSLTYRFEARRTGDGSVAARGTYTVVYVAEDGGRGTPWPDDLRALLWPGDDSRD